LNSIIYASGKGKGHSGISTLLFSSKILTLTEQLPMKITGTIRSFFLLSGAFFAWSSCHTDKPTTSYKTKHVIIFMIDGPRYSETWGDPLHQYIPNMDALAREGVIFTNFYNDGITNTINGHTAITTGYYDNLNNSGQQLPQYAGVFQYWLEATGSSGSKAWVVATKDKLAVLGDCNDPAYNGRYNPFTDCGINGLNTGYRADSVTQERLLNVLRTYRPNLLLVNFKEPDASGHQNNWNGYLNGIRKTDEYLQEVWNLISSDPYYAGSTAIFVTNDHGRHLNNVLDGFINHGDGCEGCRHINLFAAGPDFKKNVTVNVRYDQPDITATIAELLGLQMPHSGGTVMKELFKGN
jgi:hypothetical protein